MDQFTEPYQTICVFTFFDENCLQYSGYFYELFKEPNKYISLYLLYEAHFILRCRIYIQYPMINCYRLSFRS